MNFAFRLLITLVVISIVGFSLLFVAALQSKSTQEFPILPTQEFPILPTATSSLKNYDPGYYGLPDVIAGYKILGVQTSENIACIPPGTIRLVLQTSQPDLDSFLKHTPNGSVESELKKFSIKPKRWEFQYVGPGISKEDVLATFRVWDPKTFSCFALGPIPTPTDPYQ